MACFIMIRVRCCLFSKSVGIRDSNDAEVLAILEALPIFLSSFHGPLLAESDSTNAVGWLLKPNSRPWKFQFHFNEMKKISSSLVVSFGHVMRHANSMADTLAKQGVDRASPRVDQCNLLVLGVVLFEFFSLWWVGYNSFIPLYFWFSFLCLLPFSLF